MTESESVALPLGDAASTLYIIPSFLRFVKSFFKKKSDFFRKITRQRVSGWGICPMHVSVAFCIWLMESFSFLGGAEMKQAVLVGPPNCGKSSLFRLLTGKRARVGNRAGVTVEALSASVPGSDWVLTDLPGLRALSASSEDESVTVSFLRERSPDLVIAVCDATAFSVQYPLLREFQRVLFPAVPAVLVLNFCDEV